MATRLPLQRRLRRPFVQGGIDCKEVPLRSEELLVLLLHAYQLRGYFLYLWTPCSRLDRSIQAQAAMLPPLAIPVKEALPA